MNGVKLPKRSHIPFHSGCAKKVTRPKMNANDIPCQPCEGVEPSTPGLQNQCFNHWAIEATVNGVILPKSADIPLHSGCAKKVTRPKTNANGIPCQPREGVEPSTPGLRDQCSDHWANEATLDGVILPKSSDISPCILGVRNLSSNRKRIQMELSESIVTELNSRPMVHETSALTTELTRQLWTVSFYQNDHIFRSILDLRKRWPDRKWTRMISLVSLVRESNPRPLVYKTSALTTELSRQPWTVSFYQKRRYSFTFWMCEKGHQTENERERNPLSASWGSRTLDPWFTRPVL